MASFEDRIVMMEERVRRLQKDRGQEGLEYVISDNPSLSTAGIAMAGQAAGITTGANYRNREERLEFAIKELQEKGGVENSLEISNWFVRQVRIVTSSRLTEMEEAISGMEMQQKKSQREPSVAAHSNHHEPNAESHQQALGKISATALGPNTAVRNAAAQILANESLNGAFTEYQDSVVAVIKESQNKMVDPKVIKEAMGDAERKLADALQQSGVMRQVPLEKSKEVAARIVDVLQHRAADHMIGTAVHATHSAPDPKGIYEEAKKGMSQQIAVSGGMETSGPNGNAAITARGSMSNLLQRG